MIKRLMRKTKFILSLLCILSVLFSIAAVPSFAANNDFDSTLVRLQNLEDLAKSFKQSSYTSDSVDFLVLSYIRSSVYNSGTWNTLAGTANSSFISYVASESPDTAKLRSTYSLQLPNGDTTDFIHMFAVMNMILEGNGDLGGWIGDTCQFVHDFKSYSGSANYLEDIAKEHFRIDGHFGKEDWIADLDGYNVCNIKSINESWASCFEKYFTADLTERARVSAFVESMFGSTYLSSKLSQKNYRSAVSSHYTGLELWALEIKEFGGSLSSEYKNAAINTVADYMYLVISSPDLAPDEATYQDGKIYMLKPDSENQILAATYDENGKMLGIDDGNVDYDIMVFDVGNSGDVSEANVFYLNDNAIPISTPTEVEIN